MASYRQRFLAIGLGVLTLIFFVALVEVAYRIREQKTYLFSQYLFVNDPDSDFRFRPSTHGWVRRPEYQNDIVTNTFGFRDKERAAGAASGTVRMVVVGDSMTVGYSVPMDQTFTARLEQSFSDRGVPIEVVNAGTPAWDINHQLGFLRSRAFDLNPDLIMLVFCYNDIQRLTDVTPISVKDGYLISGIAQPGIVGRMFHTLRSWGFVYQVMNGKLSAMGWLPTPSNSDDNFEIESVRVERRHDITDQRIQNYQRKLAEFQKLAADHGVPVVFVVLPNMRHTVPAYQQQLMEQYHERERDSLDFSRLYGEVETASRALGMETVNFFPVFTSLPDPQLLHWQTDDHLTVIGNEVVFHKLESWAASSTILGSLLGKAQGEVEDVTKNGSKGIY